MAESKPEDAAEKEKPPAIDQPAIPEAKKKLDLPEIPQRKPQQPDSAQDKDKTAEKAPEDDATKLDQGRGKAFNLDVKNRFARLRNIEKELEEEEERER